MKGKVCTDVQKAHELIKKGMMTPLEHDELVELLEFVYNLTSNQLTRAEFRDAAKEAADNWG